MLEKTRTDDALLVSEACVSAWNGLRVDQQLVVQKQVWRMRKKKFPVRPHLVNYFSAIANAVNVEKASASKISEFIQIAGLVIDSEPTPKALNFLRASNVFFAQHALHYEKSSRLYARDDDYTFEFITPAPLTDMYDTSYIAPTEEVSAQNIYTVLTTIL